MRFALERRSLVLRANANAAPRSLYPFNAQFAIDFKAIPSVATAIDVLSRSLKSPVTGKEMQSRIGISLFLVRWFKLDGSPASN